MEIPQRKLVDEKSPKWLLIKGAGGAITLLLGGIIAYFAFSSFDISNSARLAEQLNKSMNMVDSLKKITDQYESKRFTIHREETRVLFSDLRIYLSGRNRDNYMIWKGDSIISSHIFLPQGKPVTFSADGQGYFALVERVFRTKDSSAADSAIIYWDSLNTH